ncbi:MAG TPA: methyltransferase domain-containing protein [Pirellulales bacterium]|jgi:ubiquinone/menaquinone biosynthesis C-methylase UbiE|nr:methyltransferase domain-containing protein [Pirellulales bacterium]
MHRLASWPWIVLFCLAGLTSRLPAADPAANAPATARPRAEKIPRPLTRYQGRDIAQTMHYTGAPWLVRESRQREEDCQLLLDALHLQPGQTVCDMGCGNGFYTLQMAERVGPTGRVFAVDVQSEMLHMLAERAREAGLKNIKPVLGTLVDPKLPAGQFDLILLVDVYHEFSHPEEMLAAMRQALKPHGRLALAEFRLEDPDVPIKLLHKMSKKQVLKEFPPNGLKLVEQFDKLPWQHLMFFEPATPEADAADSPDSRPGARPK